MINLIAYFLLLISTISLDQPLASGTETTNIDTLSTPLPTSVSRLKSETKRGLTKSVSMSSLFEQEVMQYARLDDLIYYKYDSLSLDSQKICKLAAVLAIKVSCNC